MSAARSIREFEQLVSANALQVKSNTMAMEVAVSKILALFQKVPSDAVVACSTLLKRFERTVGRHECRFWRECRPQCKFHDVPSLWEEDVKAYLPFVDPATVQKPPPLTDPLATAGDTVSRADFEALRMEFLSELDRLRSAAAQADETRQLVTDLQHQNDVLRRRVSVLEQERQVRSDNQKLANDDTLVVRRIGSLRSITSSSSTMAESVAPEALQSPTSAHASTTASSFALPAAATATTADAGRTASQPASLRHSISGGSGHVSALGIASDLPRAVPVQRSRFDISIEEAQRRRHLSDGLLSIFPAEVVPLVRKLSESAEAMVTPIDAVAPAPDASSAGRATSARWAGTATPRGDVRHSLWMESAIVAKERPRGGGQPWETEEGRAAARAMETPWVTAASRLALAATSSSREAPLRRVESKSKPETAAPPTAAVSARRTAWDAVPALAASGQRSSSSAAAFAIAGPAPSVLTPRRSRADDAAARPVDNNDDDDDDGVVGDDDDAGGSAGWREVAAPRREHSLATWRPPRSAGVDVGSGGGQRSARGPPTQQERSEALNRVLRVLSGRPV